MKKILALILSLAIVLSCFAGCQPSDVDPTESEKSTMSTESAEDIQNVDTNPTTDTTEEPTENTNDPIDKNIVGALGFNEFDSELISYINGSMAEENYMVSPTSLKMAMALLAAGAETETLDEILNAMGFESVDSYLAWAKSITDLEFDDSEDKDDNNSENSDGTITEKFSVGKKDSAFSIGYGIWHNANQPGAFRDIYKDRLQELNAMFAEVPGDQLHIEINNWVDEKTNGLIPQLFAESLEEYANILVNTVYLKGAWINDFSESNTKDGDFTTISGEIVTKELMHQESQFKYYEDKDTQLLIMDLDNGFKVAFVLGNNEDVLDAIENAQRQLVNVTLPKFEIDTTFNNEMTDFLKNTGINTAFSDVADFSTMMDSPVKLDSVIQKTKLKVDENGLEAAAATSAMMMGNAIQQEKPEPVYFTADKPFTFYVFTDDVSLESPELLFYGQYVK